MTKPIYQRIEGTIVRIEPEYRSALFVIPGDATLHGCPTRDRAGRDVPVQIGDPASWWMAGNRVARIYVAGRRVA